MREKQGRGGNEKHIRGGTEKRTTFGTDGQTDRGSYRSGAHLKMDIFNVTENTTSTLG